LNCVEFHRAVGADPNHLGQDAIAHRESCAACAQFAAETQRLDGLIKRALEIPAPQKGRAFTFPPARVAPQNRWYAMAASVLLAMGLGLGVLWFGGGVQVALAKEVVSHLNHEPDAMTESEVRVSSTLLDSALQAKGLRLAAPIGDISYVANCWVRNAFVPHVVVQTARGPVTVIVLPHEPVAAVERFDEAPYHGEMMPMGSGSIVVIANDATLIDEVASKVRTAIVWQ
jgi:hypothetical protein